MKKKFISTNMKIFILVLFILSITFYTSGCIVLVQSGYKLSDYADELHVNPNSFKYDINLSGFNFDFNASYVSKDYTINDNINEINFNLNSQDIKVISYDGDSLKVQIKSYNTISNDLSETEIENKITLGTRYDTPSNASISVSIPNKLKDKSTLKIITSSGDIDVSNLSIDTLNLTTASGEINTVNSNLNYLSLNNSSGSINFNGMTALAETKLTSSSGDIHGEGTLGILNGSTSSGDIDLRFVNSLNNVSLSTQSGSVNLLLPKISGYKVNYETVSGDLNSHSNSLSSGDESSLINVNTVSGDLNIN
ncbi:hypothetical protein D2A34_04715 [Clostridium chromiireducens]|uniref:DUF4097 domain-containing protein n=1 Tax=Clostridium chromiireducens TaxID=225345 RepID=A0A399IUE9_9CLOT|nr:DUF4097 family beta strand repeat-containing protein [Clostridium chromiireducens]RII36693.1 hypothetical protein D2A34_04715 [Clostridium chromiireducens]